jgi:hypothetical protein
MHCCIANEIASRAAVSSEMRYEKSIRPIPPPAPMQDPIPAPESARVTSSRDANSAFDGHVEANGITTEIWGMLPLLLHSEL